MALVGLLAGKQYPGKTRDDVFGGHIAAQRPGCGAGVEHGLDCRTQVMPRVGRGDGTRGKHGPQRLGHALFGGHEVGVPSHPDPQGPFGRHGGDQVIGPIAQARQFVAVHSLDQFFPRREMPVERADADAGIPRDPLERHGLRRGEGFQGHLEDSLAVSLRIRALTTMIIWHNWRTLRLCCSVYGDGGPSVSTLHHSTEVIVMVETTKGYLGRRPVTRVGFGVMQLEAAERGRAVDLLRRAVDLGVDHIDTAQFYGNGYVNELIRTALCPYREDLVVVSKVGAVHDSHGKFGLAPGQRPHELRASVEANLASLGVERLDVVNLRRLDGPGPGIEATGVQVVELQDQLAELVAMREEGKIGDIGLSNVTAEQLRQAFPANIVCVQNSYHLLDRSAEDVLDECRAHDIAWVPFFPLGSALPGMAKVVDHPVVIAAAEREGMTPAQVGLAWLLAHDRRVLLIPGTTDAAHLEQNVKTADMQLSPDTMIELDELSG